MAEEPLRAPLLVVDDDPAVRGMIQAGLEALGYAAETAADAAQARECLRERNYSLVLCDYEMPGGTGLDLLEHVSQAHPDLPFILLTGRNETALAKTSIATGATDFLTKPFELAQLARAIEQNWTRFDRDREQAALRTGEILSGTIRALVAAVDAKDPHTATHSERVAALALQLGEAAGLPSERLQVLEFAALLHDVGKIGIPESILLKPGPLNDEEWTLMRQHPVRSAEIVGQVPALREVATLVRHHHERMDGSGYPDGLRGAAIPMLARIICIADVYEALTAARAYRGALPPAQARVIVASSLGAHFDETLGQLFIALGDRLC